MGLFSRGKTPERLETVQQDLSQDEVKRIVNGRVSELDMRITPRSLASGIFKHMDAIANENQGDRELNAIQTFLQANMMHTALRLDMMEEYLKKGAGFDRRISLGDVWDAYQFVIKKIPEEERKQTAMGAAVSVVSAANMINIITPEFAQKLAIEGAKQGIVGFSPEMVVTYMKKAQAGGALRFGKEYSAAQSYAIRLSSELQRQYVLPGMIRLGIIEEAKDYGEMERRYIALYKAKGINVVSMDRQVSFIGRDAVHIVDGKAIPISTSSELMDSLKVMEKASDIALRKMGFDEGFAGFDTANLLDTKRLNTFLRIRDKEAERLRKA
ncbi:MAG: hypothetical protein KGH58_04620 [Candidatus Micrarchaeota archaeon]|nr:hypothetical protein [Candidatus Micrarchaeota archaeon]